MLPYRKKENTKEAIIKAHAQPPCIFLEQRTVAQQVLGETHLQLRTIFLELPTANDEKSSEDSNKKVNSRLKSESVKCLWSISSKGCIFKE